MDMRQAEQCRLAMAHEARVKAGIEAMIRKHPARTAVIVQAASSSGGFS
jgi:hypothetical protein